MRRAFIVLSLLVASFVVAAIAVPRILNKDAGLADPAYVAIARNGDATTTPFQPLLIFSTTPTASSDSSALGCTYTLYYWKLHPEAWPDQIVISGSIFTKNQAKALVDQISQDPSVLLTQQLYATFLNIYQGSNPAPVQKTLLDASNWISENPPGAAMSEFNRQRGLSLEQTLDQYNNGEFGPPLCPNQPPTPALTPSSSAQQGGNSANNTTQPALPATSTLRPYEPPPTPKPYKPPATHEKRPTLPPATAVPPTQAPTPVPTKQQPTQPPPPPPTATKVPLPTPVPTQVPVPTPAPQSPAQPSIQPTPTSPGPIHGHPHSGKHRGWGGGFLLFPVLLGLWTILIHWL